MLTSGKIIGEKIMGSSVIKAKVKIRGERPLLWHSFGPDAIPLEKQERTGVAGNDPEEWKKTVLHTKDGRLFFEPSYVFGTIRDGAKYTKRGRGSLQSFVAATLVIDDELVFTDQVMPDDLTQDREQPVYLDVRSVKNPATKGRNVRYRVAAKKGWTAEFTLLWDKTVVSRAEMEAATIDAGRLSGIGDGRAIGFGRFEVEDFAVVD